MFEIVHRHEVIAIFLMVALTAALVIHYERWADRRALREPFDLAKKGFFIWQCVQFQGGGNVNTPCHMNRQQACEWCSKLGAIAYVDETHHKIFYRPRS